VIRLWEMPSGKLLKTLRGHAELIYCVAFHSSGTRIVTAATDNTVRLWDAANGEVVLTIPFAESVYAALFSPDGRQLLVAPMDGTVQMLTGAPK
jgi:WD40 repeat protein